MSHSHPGNKVPAEIVAQRRADWHLFTRGIFWNCIAVAGVLLLMLLFLRIL